MSYISLTVRNYFHDTETTIRAEMERDEKENAFCGQGTVYVTEQQIKRARNRLCGIRGCCCSCDYMPKIGTNRVEGCDDKYFVAGC